MSMKIAVPEILGDADYGLTATAVMPAKAGHPVVAGDFGGQSCRPK
jgi:hypothetical protein